VSAPDERVEVRIEDRGEAGEIARVTIAHAAKANALDSALLESLAARIEALAANARLRALVLAGAGPKAFIAGANVQEMSVLDAVSARAFIVRIHRVCAALRDLPVPAIARIHGVTLGAGVEIAAACDFRVASDRAVFAMPEVRLGIPSVVEAALLPQLIGWGRTRRWLLTGETIDALTAERWGLVEQVVAHDGLDAAIARALDDLLAAGPHAIRIQKRLIRHWEGAGIDEAIAAGVEAFVEAWDSDEPARLMRAALERRRRP